jgi:hypothetical protein
VVASSYADAIERLRNSVAFKPVATESIDVLGLVWAAGGFIVGELVREGVLRLDGGGTRALH